MNIYSVYKITHTKTSKSYIGYTSLDPECRFHLHKTAANRGSTQHIHAAFRKYGIEEFDFCVLYQSYDKTDALRKETLLIEEYNTFGGVTGYNHTMGGEDNTRSAAVIEKHRQAILGRKQSESHKKKKADAIRGKKNGMYGKLPINPFTKDQLAQINAKIQARRCYWYIKDGELLMTKNKDELISMVGDLGNALKNFNKPRKKIYEVYYVGCFKDGETPEIQCPHIQRAIALHKAR
jgi:group I intron endonuclease